jgi:hypothetical protein
MMCWESAGDKARLPGTAPTDICAVGKEEEPFPKEPCLAPSAADGFDPAGRGDSAEVLEVIGEPETAEDIRDTDPVSVATCGKRDCCSLDSVFCTFAMAAASTTFGSVPGEVGFIPIEVLCEGFRRGCCAIGVCLPPLLADMAVCPARDNPGTDTFAVNEGAAGGPLSA